MKIKKSEFFYNRNRKIKPGLTSTKAICYLVESYPEEIQKFAMSFLLNEFAKEEESIALKAVPRCKECNKPISMNIKRGSGICKECKNTFSPDIEFLERIADKMSMTDIAKLYKVSVATVSKWFKKFGINKKYNPHSRSVPPKEIFLKELNEIGPRELSKKYGVIRSTITKWIKKYNIIKYEKYKYKFYE